MQWKDTFSALIAVIKLAIQGQTNVFAVRIFLPVFLLKSPDQFFKHAWTEFVFEQGVYFFISFCRNNKRYN